MSQAKEMDVSAPEPIEGKCRRCGSGDLHRYGEEIICHRCNQACPDDYRRTYFVKPAPYKDKDSIH